MGKLETISVDAVKTRLYSPAITVAGDQSDNNHTAITLKLLAGRSDKLKEKFATNILARAKMLISEGSLSVEIVDLQVYKK